MELRIVDLAEALDDYIFADHDSLPILDQVAVVEHKFFNALECAMGLQLAPA